MRPKYVPYVVIGIVLVYLSMFGLEGFGLGWTSTSLPMTEDFDTLSGWLTSSAIISPAGQLQLQAGVGSDKFDTSSVIPAEAIHAVDSYTIKWKMKVDNWGTGPILAFILSVHFNSYFYAIYPDKVVGSTTGGAEGTSWPHIIDTAWHTYTIVGTVSTLGVHSVQLSIDTTIIGSETSWGSTILDSLNLRVWSGAVAHIEYIQITSGAVLPSYSDVTISVVGQGTTVPAVGRYLTTYTVGGSLTITATPASGWTLDYMTHNGVTMSSMTLSPLLATENVVVYFKTGSPTTGTLRVFASYNGAYVVASITATGPQTVSGSTTASSTNPLTFTVAAGTYTVSGSYSSGSASPVSVTVPAGGSADASLNFGGSTPIPDILGQILAKIKEIFQNSTVKQLLLVVGVGMAGIGGIMFILPEKHAPSPAPRPAYYQ